MLRLDWDMVDAVSYKCWLIVNLLSAYLLIKGSEESCKLYEKRTLTPSNPCKPPVESTGQQTSFGKCVLLLASA